MSSSGFSGMMPFLRGIISQSIKADIQQQAVRLINLPDDLQSVKSPTRIEGEIVSKNADNTVTLKTDRGEMRVSSQGLDRYKEGQRLQLDIPAGKPPREALARPSLAKTASADLAQNPLTASASKQIKPDMAQATQAKDIPITRSTKVASSAVTDAAIKSAESLPKIPEAKLILAEGSLIRLTSLGRAVLSDFSDASIYSIKKIVTGLPPNVIKSVLINSGSLIQQGQTSTVQSTQSAFSFPGNQIPAQPQSQLIYNLFTNSPSQPTALVQANSSISTGVNIQNGGMVAPGAHSTMLTTSGGGQNTAVQPPRLNNGSLIANVASKSGQGMTFSAGEVFNYRPSLPFGSSSAEGGYGTNTPQQMASYPVNKPLRNLSILDGRVVNMSPGASFPARQTPQALSFSNQMVLNGRPGAIPFQVIGFTKEGFPSLIPMGVSQNTQTGQSVFSLNMPVANIQKGSFIFLQPINYAQFGMSGSSLLSGWDNLNNLEVLKNPGASSLLQAMSPMVSNSSANPTQIVSSALFLFAALGAGGVDQWLGQRLAGDSKHEKIIKLLESITKEGGSINRLVSAPSGEWRVWNFPLQYQEQFVPVNLYVQNYGQEQNGNKGHEKESATRFVFEFDLTRMGTLQIDGMMREKNLDIFIRTEREVSKNMKTTIRGLYLDALSKSELEGDVAFQTRKNSWVELSETG